MSQVFDYNDLSIGVKKPVFEGTTEECKEWCVAWLIRNDLGSSITWRLDNRGDWAARAYDPEIKRERLFFVLERPQEEKTQESETIPETFYVFRWLSIFDTRQLKAIRDCVLYYNDPYGDVAHNLKVVVSLLVFELINIDHITELNEVKRDALLKAIEERIASA
jgi:hypothetical protein